MMNFVWYQSCASLGFTSVGKKKQYLFHLKKIQVCFSSVLTDLIYTWQSATEGSNWSRLFGHIKDDSFTNESGDVKFSTRVLMID